MENGIATITFPFDSGPRKTHLTRDEETLCEQILQDLKTAGINSPGIVKAIHYCRFLENGTLLPIKLEVELSNGSSSLSADLNIEIDFQDGSFNLWAARVFLYPNSLKYKNKEVPVTDEMKALGYQILLAKPDTFSAKIPAVRIDSLCTSFFNQGYISSAGIVEIGCDCYPQSQLAKNQIHSAGGLSILTPFSGRGNGAEVLSSEIQMQNFAVRNMLPHIPNTYDAHMLQGYPKDNRHKYFWIDGLILSRLFGLKSLQLLTNNPEKIDAVKSYGISVTAKQHKDETNIQYYLGINAEAKRLLGNHTT